MSISQEKFKQMLKEKGLKVTNQRLLVLEVLACHRDRHMTVEDIYDLVKEYNQFYHDFSILREENPELKNFRLVLSANVAKIVKSGMDLLGIEVPERM